MTTWKSVTIVCASGVGSLICQRRSSFADSVGEEVGQHYLAVEISIHLLQFLSFVISIYKIIYGIAY